MSIGRLSNLSFGASVKRESLRHLFSKKTIDNPTLKDITDDYDAAIENIRRQKQSAIELDEFMHSDEVKAALDKLPKNDSVKICSRYRGIYIKNGLHLMYLTDNGSIISKILNNPNNERYFSSKEAQNSDGSIDKEGILSWLNSICEVLK